MMNDGSNLAGRTLGNCVLRRLLGRGGTSVVYLAQQMRPSRNVAVKILLPNAAVGSEVHNEFLARFRHEADIIAKLEHPNIIPIFEYNEQDGLAYLVMPYLTGGTLNDLLKRYGSLSLEEALVYIEQAADALDYAHTQGVIHRDLKPSNFLLYRDGRLVLADFGIARIMQGTTQAFSSTLTSPGIVVGTVDYLSPEMALGNPIDHRSDIYELGIVLFQMLSGDLPFKGRDPYSIMLQHAQRMPPLLHLSNASIPIAVDRVIQQATAKNPEDRFASAGDMAQALREAIETVDYQSEAESASYSPISFGVSRPAFAQYASINHAGNERLVTQSPPQYSSSTAVSYAKQRNTWQTVILGAVIFALIAALSGGVFFALLHHSESSTDSRSPGNLLNHPSPTPTPTPPIAFTEARAAVSQFYKDLNARNYQAALNWIVTSQSLCNFAGIYSRTLDSTITFGNEQLLPDGSVKVPITIQATESIDEGMVMRVYSTYQIVKQINNIWRIVEPGHLQQIGPTKIIAPIATISPSESQAQAIISQYYTDISNQDYRDAYSLLGTGLQGSTSYCQFLLGHVQILHDDVTFGDSTTSRNGLSRVTATISETKQTSSGQTTNSYSMTYVVGQENNSWKILDERSS